MKHSFLKRADIGRIFMKVLRELNRKGGTWVTSLRNNTYEHICKWTHWAINLNPFRNFLEGNLAFMQRCSPLTVPGTIPKSQPNTNQGRRGVMIVNSRREEMGRRHSLHYNPAPADLPPKATASPHTGTA